MSGHRLDPPQVITVNTRRVWSAEDKRAILAEAAAPGETVSSVARRHGVHSSLVFRWRKAAHRVGAAATTPSQPAFVPLALPGPCEAPRIERAPGLIEIELAGGHRLRADASVDLAMLRGVIAALVGR